jgi:hypothetical protein
VMPLIKVDGSIPLFTDFDAPLQDDGTSHRRAAGLLD